MHLAAAQQSGSHSPVMIAMTYFHQVGCVHVDMSSRLLGPGLQAGKLLLYAYRLPEMRCNELADQTI